VVDSAENYGDEEISFRMDGALVVRVTAARDGADGWVAVKRRGSLSQSLVTLMYL
jgi:hypothetical protein